MMILTVLVVSTVKERKIKESALLKGQIAVKLIETNVGQSNVLRPGNALKIWFAISLEKHVNQ